MFVVSESFGAYIINMTRIYVEGVTPLCIIGEIDILKNITNKAQYDNSFDNTKYATLKISSFTINLPTTILFITNYGVFIFDFSVDISDSEGILNKMN